MAALERARFVDGRATAGFAARTVKNNQQADGTDRSLETIRQLLAERILANEMFQHRRAAEGALPAPALAL